MQIFITVVVALALAGCMSEPNYAPVQASYYAPQPFSLPYTGNHNWPMVGGSHRYR